MSDQQAPSPEDSPAVAGPDGTPGAAQDDQRQYSPADVDWQKRYVDTQADYTVGQQRIRELEDRQAWFEMALTSEDEDTRRQAIEALGYELPEEELDESAEEEYQDPYEVLQQQVHALQERFDTNQQQSADNEELQLQQALIEERLAAMEGVDEEDKDDILAYAINALPAVQEDGVPVLLPDLQAAYERHMSRQTNRQKQWASTKRAPYVAPGGQTANEVPDLSTHEGRVEHALRRMAEHDMAE